MEKPAKATPLLWIGIPHYKDIELIQIIKYRY